MEAEGELREGGKMVDKKCSKCGTKVPCAITRGTSKFGQRKTTAPENHNPLCRAKVLLGKRRKWRTK